MRAETWRQSYTLFHLGWECTALCMSVNDKERAQVFIWGLQISVSDRRIYKYATCEWWGSSVFLTQAKSDFHTRHLPLCPSQLLWVGPVWLGWLPQMKTPCAARRKVLRRGNRTCKYLPSLQLLITYWWKNRPMNNDGLRPSLVSDVIGQWGIRDGRLRRYISTFYSFSFIFFTLN